MDTSSFAYLLARNRALIASTPLAHQRALVEQLRPERRLQIVLGARGVGKTTVLLQYARLHLPAATTAYLSLDDLLFSDRSLLDTVSELHDHGVRYVLLDEVHRYANWSREVKLAYDRFPALRQVVTGSSLSHLVAGEGDLSRRAVRFELRGLTWREWLSLSGQASLAPVTLDGLLADPMAAALAAREAVDSPVASFAEYLRRGYFPFTVEETVDAAYLQQVRAAAHLVIDLDLATVAALKPETTYKLKRLLALVAEGSPYVPNVTTIAQQISAERRQAYKLLELAERAHLIRRLWAAGATPKTLTKPEKLYLDNTNLSFALGNADLGNLRETAFLQSVTAAKVDVRASRYGDFEVDGTHFEVGGPRKGRKQIAAAEHGFVVADGVELPAAGRIPLYLFGMLA